ncbi:hypothetical protein SIN8267_03442 [Sinobacterium norvegicum]|uniref:Chemotaxis methyl-accepting receptor HlyB-like 4HB MCP domain-containing protein n=1 Tax=Sinobacterium norvegicum TaxID=1641715 RepID=A0ABN8EPJ8_9GAMM|nr:hypothetical protein [Sinobacterium norvegicum]CAH0993294.1 hypothetical protein SIN8267_03442 [Sinobacterium norvegicum]
MVRKYSALLTFLTILVVSILCLAQLHQVNSNIRSQASHMLDVQLPRLESISKAQQALNALHSLYLQRLIHDTPQRRYNTLAQSSTIEALTAATISNFSNNPLSISLFEHYNELHALQRSMDKEPVINRQSVYHAVDLITTLQDNLTKLANQTSTELEQQNSLAINSTLLFISTAEAASLCLFIAAFFLAFTLSRPSK